MAQDATRMGNIVALCKRRGFIFPSSEIYGGIGGFWDYGPLGVELKRNIKEAWWRDMVQSPPPGPDGRELSMVGLDCTIIMNPKVWEASGHLGGFSDPMVDCKECKRRFRADRLWKLRIFEPNNISKQDEFREEAASSYGFFPTGYRIGPVHGESKVLCSVETEGIAAAISMVDELLRRSGRAQNIPQLKKGFELRGPAPAVSNSGIFVVEGPGGYERFGVIEPIDATLMYPHDRPCPACGGALTDTRQFNLMFETYVGAVRDEENKAYLRPETAQGIFANFRNVLDTQRVKIPFGIAQIGKAFRNEINPRNYTFRSREFEQMEIEFFCREEEAMDWYQFWRKTRFEWYVRHGLRSDKLRLRDQKADELAHYSKACADIEYLFPFSDEHQELEGVAHRGCFDLTQHAKHSGKDLSYFDDEAWQLDAHKFKDDKDAAKRAKENPPYRFMPTVIEPSAGADRSTLAFLCEAYTEDEAPDDKGAAQQRVVMKFHPRLAPIKAAVFPLVNKEGMPEIAESLYHGLKQEVTAFYDVSGAIGRRYRRQDEIGTPFCITVDGQTLEDETVTVRDRDSLEQVRVKREGLRDWLKQRLAKS